MSRMQIKPDLGEMIDSYKSGKDQENSLKKENTLLGNTIKDEMHQRDLTEFESDTWKATVTLKENEDFNEEQAIEIIKSQLTDEEIQQVIRTKEYIDDDALEKLIYNKKFDAKKLNCCRTLKEPTATLRISKRK